MDKDSFLKLAHLAKIQCTPDEQEAFLGDLETMVIHFKQLQDVDTENIAPCYNILSQENSVYRDDIIEFTMDPKSFLKNTISKDGMIAIPPLLKS